MMISNMAPLPVHLMSDDLLDECGQAAPGALRTTPVEADVTCLLCKRIVRERREERRRAALDAADRVTRFLDHWPSNHFNGDVIYATAWMEGPDDDRHQVQSEITVSDLRALIAGLR